MARAPGEALGEVFGAAPHGASTPGRPDRGPTAPVARRWSVLSGEPPVDWNAAPLRPGDVLERSRLAVTLAVHLGAGRPLGLDARPLAATGSPSWLPDVDLAQLSFSIAAVDLVQELPLWVMADIRPRGFDPDRLAFMFADPGPPGRAYCFVDTPEDAVRVIEWGLARHGVHLPEFRWQPAA